MAIVISCAGNNALAKRLFGFLSKSFWLSFSSVSIDHDKITIESGLPVIKSGDVQWLLEAYLALNDDLKKYSITKTGKLLTIRYAKNIDGI